MGCFESKVAFNFISANVVSDIDQRLIPVGIAVGAGTDVAIETADIILVKSNPNDVAAIIRLAKATNGNMIQSYAKPRWWGVSVLKRFN